MLTRKNLSVWLVELCLLHNISITKRIITAQKVSFIQRPKQVNKKELKRGRFVIKYFDEFRFFLQNPATDPELRRSFHGSMMPLIFGLPFAPGNV